MYSASTVLLSLWLLLSLSPGDNFARSIVSMLLGEVDASWAVDLLDGRLRFSARGIIASDDDSSNFESKFFLVLATDEGERRSSTESSPLCFVGVGDELECFDRVFCPDCGLVVAIRLAMSVPSLWIEFGLIGASKDELVCDGVE